jgi:hypothetical protein
MEDKNESSSLWMDDNNEAWTKEVLEKVWEPKRELVNICCSCSGWTPDVFKKKIS